ncbi:hypothetical protein ACLOJK_012881 [Asimina triloba]
MASPRRSDRSPTVTALDLPTGRLNFKSCYRCLAATIFCNICLIFSDAICRSDEPSRRREPTTVSALLSSWMENPYAIFAPLVAPEIRHLFHRRCTPDSTSHQSLLTTKTP